MIMEKVRIIKDSWFSKNQWFVVWSHPGAPYDGAKLHEVGFKSKKLAVLSVKQLVGVELEK